MTAVVVGAQVTQPDDPAARPEFARRVLDLPGVTGLEIAFGSATWRDHDSDWLPRILPQGSRNTVSLMGVTMERADSGFGFASVEQDSRREAVQVARQACDLVARLHDEGAGTVAVLVHSAPTIDPLRVREAGDALRESLDELAGWDWRGASIVVEHCDARYAGRGYLKGYLPLEEELRVVSELDGARVGVAINWGRSAIEGRDASTPVSHVDLASRSGALHGIMASGVSARAGTYGPAWADSHPPARATREHPCGEASSLLELAALHEYRRAAGTSPLAFVGAKVAVREPLATLRDRLAVNAAILDGLGVAALG